MFGIGGGELIFIIFIALMLFGTDKIPEAARTFGKVMANLKHATNEIKTEIQKSADVEEINSSFKQVTSSFTEEVDKVKESVSVTSPDFTSNTLTDATSGINEIKEDLESLTGPIKKTKVMLEKIIAIDKDLLVFLNGLGSEAFDEFWLIITKQVYWTPYFLLVFYFLAKKIGWKNFLIALVFIALLILVSDQTSNFFKNHFQRLRPCNDLDLKNIIRIVKPSDSYSFFSGHATNSMATTVFVFLIITRYYKYALLLFLFPLIFAFSRIYLGLHFPTDILTGYAFGATFGLVFYKIYQKYILKD